MSSITIPPPHKMQTSESSRTLFNRSESGGSLHVRESGQPRRIWVPDPNSPEQDGRSRTIVICFDGTGDQYDDDNSNIVQLVSALKKDNQNQQLVYYQPGIGTYTSNAFVTPFVVQATKVLDEMFAWNLGKHVQAGYEFLMQNYTEGDVISIFGFSRGSYTARALAGMVQKVGLLPPSNHAQVPFAWDMYQRQDEDGLRCSEGFKKAFCSEVVIDFIGVWDTVASVGLVDRELPFVSTNSAIRIFRHALALDEHRAKFMPNFYHPAKPAVEAAEAAKACKRKRNGEDEASQIYQAKINEEIGKASGVKTDALEVWFAGAHCDIGGGSVLNGSRNSLARIPLRWMIRECFKTNTGIIFDKDMLKSTMGIDADTLYPFVLERPPRLHPHQDDSILDRIEKPSSLISFAKAIGGLLIYPFEIIYRLLKIPLHQLWLLVKFTGAGKKLRSLFGKGGDHHDHDHPQAPYTRVPVEEDLPPFVSEEEEELTDALCPEYDQLQLAWFWWIIECLPFRFRDQKGNHDDFFVRANWGRGRKIYGDAMRGGLQVHRSVKTRLEVLGDDGKSAYRPRAWFSQHTVKEHEAQRGFKGMLHNFWCTLRGADRMSTGPQNWDVDHPADWEWVD